MSQQLTVPDLGDFDDIPVIEVLVKPGDTIAKDDPIVTLESDKATMEVPAAQAGTVEAVAVKVGDRVSKGTVLITLTGSASDDMASPPNQSGSTAAATTELTVPDIGDFHEIPVIEVLVAVGDTVKKEDAIATLESDKATMEVPASHAGTITELRVKVGDKVSKGSVLAVVSGAKTPPAAVPAAAVRSAHEDAAAKPAPPRAEQRAQAPVAVAPRPQAPPPAPNGNGKPVHASPAIRRFARELGVALHGVRGSGPNGRITRDDVQGYVKSALAGGAAPAAPHAGSTSGLGLGLPPWPSVDFARFGEIERVPLTRIQRISGPALARNWVMIPHVTQNEDADVTDLEAFRKQVNGERKDVKLTMLAFLMKASVYALQQQPMFNSSLDGDELVLKKYYHLGFAADTPQGLLVPVIRDVDKKGVLDIARETSELAAKAREGKLGPNDMSGATFTISSLGSIGGTTFTPIINAPEVAILGACRAEMRPVWNGETFVPRLIQPLSLSYDHRVIDGAKAARFCVAIKDALADLRRTML